METKESKIESEKVGETLRGREKGKGVFSENDQRFMREEGEREGDPEGGRG